MAKKPYLELAKSLHDQLAKTGKKTVKISIHQNGRKSIQAAKKTTSLKRQLEFAEKTYDLPLLTVNIRHFDRVDGLQLIDPNTLPIISQPLAFKPFFI